MVTVLLKNQESEERNIKLGREVNFTMGETEDDDVCIACGDGADSAEELEELIEEKSQE